MKLWLWLKRAAGDIRVRGHYQKSLSLRISFEISKFVSTTWHFNVASFKWYIFSLLLTGYCLGVSALYHSFQQSSVSHAGSLIICFHRSLVNTKLLVVFERLKLHVEALTKWIYFKSLLCFVRRQSRIAKVTLIYMIMWEIIAMISHNNSCKFDCFI